MQIDDSSPLQKMGVSFDDLLKAAFSELRKAMSIQVEKQVRLRAFDEMLLSEIIDDARFKLAKKMTRHLLVQQPISSAALTLAPEQTSPSVLQSSQQAHQDAGHKVTHALQSNETAGSASPNFESQTETPQKPRRVAFPTRKP